MISDLEIRGGHFSPKYRIIPQPFQLANLLNFSIIFAILLNRKFVQDPAEYHEQGGYNECCNK